MLETGQSLSHFRIVKLLGAGGMGEVYLAEDTKLQRKVALKILLGEFLEDKERTERFQREARTAAQISHPNVMGIYEIGSAPDPTTGKELTYIVMEYIEGRSLNRCFEDKTADINEIIRIAEHIASGLAAAHKINVVHRDIKAGNIIIDNDGHPKILDFGLAKPVAPKSKGESDTTDTISQDLTQAGKIVGTIAYMSPEQIRGEAVDNRSDIFAFGILLYRLATGTPPFEGDTQVSIMAKILETQPAPPRTKNERIPTELERIIDKCLKKNPDDRYQDTRDLVVDLRNLRRQFDSDISSNISSVNGTAHKPKFSAAFIFSGKRLILIPLIVLLAIYALWRNLGTSDEKQSGIAIAGENGLAILGFENKTGNTELDWLQTGLPEILQTDLAESQTLNIIGNDRVADFLAREIKGDRDHVYSHSEYLQAARQLGARHALSGTFYKLGDKIRIDARLEEPATGKIIQTEKVIGSDPFAMVDSLTDKIARSLQIDMTNLSGSGIAAITSSSPEAYRIYLQGMEKLNIELTEEAIDVFKRAIVIDSTFALPYMRIGMAHIFAGRQQEGATWFAKAREYRQRLPIWERNLLDIYINLWLDKNFDDAFTQMKTLVGNYPNDKETRTIYGLLLYGFTKDTIQTFAQFDTALQLDPHYQLALTQIANILIQEKQLERAIEYGERALRDHPESPIPYLILGGTYIQQNKYDQAAEINRDMLRQFPGYATALANLNRICIFQRNFDEAAQYVEQIRLHHGDDPYKMSDYYDWKANLTAWQGQFMKTIECNRLSLDEILKTGDSSLITTAYNSLGNTFFFLNEIDSGLYYKNLGYTWASLFQRIEYPMSIVEYAPELADSAIPIFKNGMKDLRGALPSQFWPLFDGLENYFTASLADDTTAMITAYKEIIDCQIGVGEGEKRSLAHLYANTGKYDEAIEILEKFLTDDTQSSQAVTNFSALYYLGLAYEGKGDAKNARKTYEKFLKYWGNPDTEVEKVTDVKKHLAALTS